MVLLCKSVTLVASDQQVPEQNQGRKRVQLEEEQASLASRCFSFWVLARKGQLRAALNEAGSHPINCLDQRKSCSLDGAAQKITHLLLPLPPSPPPKLEQEVMDKILEKLYASIRQSCVMFEWCVYVLEFVFLLVCLCQSECGNDAHFP